MKVVHVVPGIAHEASGPSYSVPRLCQALAESGTEIELHTTETKPDLKGCSYSLMWHPMSFPWLRRLGRSKQLRLALHKAAASADIVHNHSLWSLANVYPAQAIRGTRCQLITSPRGTLSPWALGRSSLRKSLMWHTLQSGAVLRANCLHATSTAEYNDIRNFGARQPVAIIPNGVDLPPTSLTNKKADPPRVLFLGRIHPVKGLDLLLEAWRQSQEELYPWELHLVGPGEEGHIRTARDSIAKLNLKRVHLRGPAYGADKHKEYSLASIYILPSHSENFAMTVAEALGHQLPCIVSQGAPWSEIEEQNCGWWIPNTVKSLTEALMKAAATSALERESMGKRGRQLVTTRYSWNAVAEKMIATYSWLLGEADQPQCIRLG